MKAPKLITVGVKISIFWAICLCTHARADTFTVPLSFVAQTGDAGQFLSANYDFHTQFSEIDSVALQFTMPGGYEGGALAGGTFIELRTLLAVVHDSNSAPTFDFTTLDPSEPPSPPTEATATAFDIPEGEPQQYTLNAGDSWPDFLFSGQGALAMTDYEDFSTNGGPVPPPGFVGTNTITWSLPREVTDARLIIVGTAAPEPATVILLALCCAGAWLLSFEKWAYR